MIGNLLPIPPVSISTLGTPLPTIGSLTAVGLGSFRVASNMLQPLQVGRETNYGHTYRHGWGITKHTSCRLLRVSVARVPEHASMEIWPVSTRKKFATTWCALINTLRPRQMAAIFQTTFSNAFSWMKIYGFRWRFHWSLFPSVKLTIFQRWFR